MAEKGLTKKEREELIDSMLHNEKLEQAIQNTEGNTEENMIKYWITVCGSIFDSYQENAALVMGVDREAVPFQKDRIDLITEIEIQDCPFKYVDDENGATYLLAFTNRKCLQKYDDLSGVVIRMKDMFDWLYLQNVSSGLVINTAKASLIMERDILEIFSAYLQRV